MPDLIDETAALDALAALPGLTWRRPTRDDLPGVLAAYRASETHDRSSERTSLASLHDYWDSSRSVPEEDLLLVEDGDGRVVAVGWSGCNRSVTEARRVHLGGTVVPDRRGQGIGTAVLRWELAHGQAWDATTREDGYGPLIMRAYGMAHQDDLESFLGEHGLRPVRYFFGMTRRLDEDIPTPCVDGITLTGWDETRSDEVRRVIEEAFRDHWGFTGISPEMWQDTVSGSATRLDWWVLAIDDATGGVVGAADSSAYEHDWAEQGYTEGWTDQLGVLRSHRGRGIASALLHESMRRFRAAGMEAAGLGVDAANPSGALRLYESLGYAATSRSVSFEWGADAAL